MISYDDEHVADDGDDVDDDGVRLEKLSEDMKRLKGLRGMNRSNELCSGCLDCNRIAEIPRSVIPCVLRGGRYVRAHSSRYNVASY